MQLDLNNIDKSIRAIKKQDVEMGLIINPIIDQFHLVDNEILEVCQIGKFLYCINPNLRITDKPKPPNPDFIIKVENKTIGLEHTSIIDKDKALTVFSIKNLLNKVASEYKLEHPDHKICASFHIKDDSLVIKKNNKNTLIKTIKNFVNEAVLGNFENQPDFITNITIMPNSIMSFSYIETNFKGNSLTIKDLKDAIEIKETKLTRYYKQSNMIDEFWLVLMVGSLHSASFELDENIDYRSESMFDSIYLMSDFSEEIIKIK